MPRKKKTEETQPETTPTEIAPEAPADPAPVATEEPPTS
jgi:hypothetical protein